MEKTTLVKPSSDCLKYFKSGSTRTLAAETPCLHQSSHSSLLLLSVLVDHSLLYFLPLVLFRCVTRQRLSFQTPSL